MNTAPRRGDVFLCDFGPFQENSCKQGGCRPCVIVQNNIGNAYAPTIIVVPMTTKHKKHIPTHMLISNYNALEQYSLVLGEHICTVDKSQLIRYKCTLSPQDMDKVDRVVKISLGLEEIACHRER